MAAIATYACNYVEASPPIARDVHGITLVTKRGKKPTPMAASTAWTLNDLFSSTLTSGNEDAFLQDYFCTNTNFQEDLPLHMVSVFIITK